MDETTQKATAELYKCNKPLSLIFAVLADAMANASVKTELHVWFIDEDQRDSIEALWATRY